MSQEAKKFYDSLFKIWNKHAVSEDEISQKGYNFLEALAGRRGDGDLSEPFRNTAAVLYEEYESASAERKSAFNELQNLCNASEYDEEAIAKALWKGFFPEAIQAGENAEQKISTLRSKRKISINSPAPQPIRSAADEILFTSNVLLTPPLTDPGDLNGDPRKSIIDASLNVRREKQKYWYDHPIPVGIEAHSDEVIYGLSGLADALRFEKNRGNARPDDRMTVCLSLSVTHDGLHDLAKSWLKVQLGSVDEKRFEGLDVFAFSEDESRKIVQLLKSWLDDPSDAELLESCFGVDGEYGRHYSFLKALPALWAILEDPKIKATFKIDLDQIFPQDILVAETGKSAFEHFHSPLWGAMATDSDGKKVELGMIAGALVNEKDIASGLFTPDIPWSIALPEGEDLIFYKQFPMALSTRAELMTRYGENEEYDGRETAILRFHVTGGTNGIRLDSLRRHRPFTPGFIGRAEDQGYLLSVMRPSTPEPYLRYAHASGLIMRHDKEAFASEAVKAGKSSSYVGDLLRLFVFSNYVKILTDNPDDIKKYVDPFTGCFITPMPATLSLLRLALHLMGGGDIGKREEILKLAGSRLPEWIEKPKDKMQWMKNVWQREKEGWDKYYRALDRLESALGESQERAIETARQFKRILADCKISPLK